MERPHVGASVNKPVETAPKAPSPGSHWVSHLQVTAALAFKSSQVKPQISEAETTIPTMSYTAVQTPPVSCPGEDSFLLHTCSEQHERELQVHMDTDGDEPFSLRTVRSETLLCSFLKTALGICGRSTISPSLFINGAL